MLTPEVDRRIAMAANRRNKSGGMRGIFVILAAVVCVLGGTVFGQPWDGNGVEGNPYQIWDANDMQAIGADANYWNAHFKLMADIDLSAYTGASFNIIGTSSSRAFRGSFDGNGNSIINFTYESTVRNGVGIFGYVKGANVEIRDLGLIDPNVNIYGSGTAFRTGTLVGYFGGGRISGCYVKNCRVVADYYVGGLVGYIGSGYVTDCNVTGSVSARYWVGGLGGESEGLIRDCQFSGDVSGYVRLGGLVGSNKGTILRCATLGSVDTLYTSGSRNRVGGLVGINWQGKILYSYSTADVVGHLQAGGLAGENYFGTMSYCSATGDVLGLWYVGGLVGQNWQGNISNCYSINGVSGERNVGGLVGLNSHRYNSIQRIEHCYAGSTVGGSFNVGGLVGYDENGNYLKNFWNNTVNPSLGGIGNTFHTEVIGESTTNMQMESTYSAMGWDFTSPTWTIDEGNDYPQLWWEGEEPVYGGGTGEPGDPYLICTAGQLNTIGRHFNGLDKHFRLCADIDLFGLVGTGFNVIGDGYINFTGVFDGNGHTISNLPVTGSVGYYAGLFGYVAGAARIEDVGLINPNINVPETSSVGGLIGQLRGGEVVGCYVEGGTISGKSGVGGLIASNSGEVVGCYVEGGTISGKSGVGGLIAGNSGEVTRCYATATVSSTGGAGGLLGSNSGIVIESYATGSVSGNGSVGGLIGSNVMVVSGCYSTGPVMGTGDSVGGLIGKNVGEVSECYSTAGVSGADEVGGLTGYNSGDIWNSYSAGSVNGSGGYVGGFVGYSKYSNGSGSCFWDMETSGQLTAGVNSKAVGKTTLQMKTLSTFYLWSCEPAWTIDGGVDYPHLIWEGKPGVIISKPTYGGGTGEAHDPYLIYTAEQLNAIGLIRCDLDKHFKLMADIDLSSYSGTSFNCIGGSLGLFRGVFDGDGHTISNFNYVDTGTIFIYCVGIFGDVDDPNAEIRNVGVVNPHMELEKGHYVGSLVGRLREGRVRRCFVVGGEVNGYDQVGGLIGHFGEYSGVCSVENCRANTRVSGSSHVGGLIGTSTGGSIIDCNTRGEVSGISDVGGLVGGGGGIFDSYSESAVSGNSEIGGLVGHVGAAGLSGCYSTGNVIGDTKVGGLAGMNYGNIVECYSLSIVSGNIDTGGLVGLNNGVAGVFESYSTGTVSGGENIGGLVGSNAGGSISASYSAASVFGGEAVGGLVGETGQGVVANSYSTGAVSGDDYVGSLVGHNSNGFISNCYAIGVVAGTAQTGGLVGKNSRVVSGSYWDVNTVGLETSEGGIGKTSVEMHAAETFIGWWCEEVWTIDDGNDYPHLIWEDKDGEVITEKTYFEGSGTASDPYMIYTAEQLNAVGLIICEWDKHFKLMADVDLGGNGGPQFNIVGTYYYLPFTGVFDGGGHVISNFVYASKNVDFVGLFGCLDDPNAEIRDVIIEGPSVDANEGQFVGSLVGSLEEGTLAGCSINGGRVSGRKWVGMLTGSSDGSILDCHASGAVSGDEAYTGGLVGRNSGSVLRCGTLVDVCEGSTCGGLVGYNSGNVSESLACGSVLGRYSVGGLIGNNGGKVINCYAKADVNGLDGVGGLAGNNRGEIFDCYSTGSAIGDFSTGGLIGNNYSGTVWSAFWDVNSSGLETSAGGTGKTTAEMQTGSTFTDAGWDFVWEVVNGANDIWTIWEGVDYPRLWWEGNATPVACVVGGDKVVEAGVGCEARVVLDGSCSSDADSTPRTNDDINDFDWYEVIDACDPNSDIWLGSGEVIECNLGLGEHLIVLEVTDKAGAFDSNEVVITVEDVTPPEFSLVVEPNVLWPPNNKMILVTPGWEVSDNCDDSPEVSLVDITMSAEGDVNDYVQTGGDGSIYLRATKGQGGDTRVYTITYEAVDDSGNVAIDSADVVVPHDLGGR